MGAFCSHIAAGVSVCISQNSTKNQLKNSVSDLHKLKKKFNEYKQSEEDIETKRKNILQFSKQMQKSSELDHIIKDVIEKTKELLVIDVVYSLRTMKKIFCGASLQIAKETALKSICTVA